MTREERRHLKKGLIWTVGIAAVVLIMEFKGFLAIPEGMILDWYLKSSSANFQVVTLEIDDPAYKSPQCFDDHSPLEPSLVLSLVDLALWYRPPDKPPIEAPKVVGIDLLTDSKLYSEATIPETAKCLIQKASDRGVWTVWASGQSGSFGGHWILDWARGKAPTPNVEPSDVLGESRNGGPGIPVFPPYDYVILKHDSMGIPVIPGNDDTSHRRHTWGIPVFPPDDDASLRRFPRLVVASPDPDKGPEQPTWARIIAEDYCLLKRCAGPFDNDREEMLISYGRKPSGCPPKCKVSELFGCPTSQVVKSVPLEERLNPLSAQKEKWNDFRKATAGKILLIGGTFGAARDAYDTPAGHISGLALNAYAVQTEIDGLVVTEVAPFWSLALDLLTGVCIVLIFFPPFWGRIGHWLGSDKPPAPQALTIWLVLRKISRLTLVVLPADSSFFSRGTVQRMMWVSLGLVSVLVILASILLSRFQLIWVGWLGMIVGMSPHIVVEIYQMDPRVPRHH